mmetsp:Transcript_30938/g.67849  ORF Transcript_30938/g.67849 Transcript_30938/m.67849 type:complete len:1194 (-) Transcript_30938:122-3703(-)
MQPAKDTDSETKAKAVLSGLAGIKLGGLALEALESAAAQQNLQVLDLKDNKIPAVPVEVFQAFSWVRVLDLRKNALEELLPDISVMTSLEDLLLDQNRLRELPREVCLLPKLKTLSLSQNVLKNLPSATGEMSCLRSLSLGDNHIEEIPSDIGRCSELQILHVHHNHFTKLPTSMHQLENLAELALEWFRYTTPPLPRVIKGAEWKRIISAFIAFAKDKAEKGDTHVTCIEILSQFSQKAFDPNAIDSKRRTRLHVACLEGHVGVAMSLAENGSKCDSLDCEGYSPLLVAVREEHPDIATVLVQVGVDVNRGGGLFGSPLHVATVNFDPTMVLLLIHGNADVNQTDADGNTPLHVLMSVFDKGGKRAGAIGQILLRHQADCNMMNSDKWAPLHLAARRGQLRGICFVLSHIDSVENGCLKGTCSHQPVHKKSKSSRVRTCARVFDLNLRGGSHLWTPLHLAGHACHVPVVQVLIEAGADVFLRNIDGRTARHVSRGNLAISKLLRKAEDEWLWYRITEGSPSSAKDSSPSTAEGPAFTDAAGKEDGAGPDASPRTLDNGILDDLKGDDDEDDAIEEIVKTIEGHSGAGSIGPGGGAGGSDAEGRRGPTETGGPPAPTRRKSGSGNRQLHRIVEKCRDTYFTKAEVAQLNVANFANAGGIDEFMTIFTKLTTSGPRHRLPFLLSKPWVKELVPKLLDEERCHSVLLQSSLVNNEDFIRLLIGNLPRERLSAFGTIRNKEQESLLHVLCKGSSVRAFPSTATRADILSLLLTVCPADTFNLEARDLRGQTALHLSSQSGDIGLVQVLLEHGADPNAQEETTAWTPLHFAVAKGHYALILQLLHHDATDVNQVDKFDWPPLLEACSRLDARSTSLLVNGKANLAFRNQHQFDVLKSVDTSKKDLAAKRWMSCLVVSNGFRFEESTVQLNQEDRETLDRERNFYSTRTPSANNPPFFVPDHLAPRCHSCKVLFSVTLRRCHCRSCGLVLCGDCFKWRSTRIVALDERVRGSYLSMQDDGSALNESRLTAAVELSMRERGAARKGSATSSMPSPAAPPAPASLTPELPGSGQGSAGGGSDSVAVVARPEDAAGDSKAEEAEAPRVDAGSSDEDPPIAEESPAVGLPASAQNLRQKHQLMRGFRRERGPARAAFSGPGGASSGASRTVRLCHACAAFFEAGVGETYAMLQQREPIHIQC